MRLATVALPTTIATSNLKYIQLCFSKSLFSCGHSFSTLSVTQADITITIAYYSKGCKSWAVAFTGFFYVCFKTFLWRPPNFPSGWLISNSSDTRSDRRPTISTLRIFSPLSRISFILIILPALTFFPRLAYPVFIRHYLVQFVQITSHGRGKHLIALFY